MQKFAWGGWLDGGATARQREEKTGLPYGLKQGAENLSGLSLGEVRVHRNSALPSQLQAHAYAQGSNIYLGPNQEKYLPHETWHVVQQKQGRVPTTRQLKSGVAVNDDPRLEREADVMGRKSLLAGRTVSPSVVRKSGTVDDRIIQRQALDGTMLNVAGENHAESNKRRKLEKKYATAAGIQKGNYWREKEFIIAVKKRFANSTTTIDSTLAGDPPELILEFRIAATRALLKKLSAYSAPKHVQNIAKKLDMVDHSIANDRHLLGDKSNRKDLEGSSTKVRSELSNIEKILEKPREERIEFRAKRRIQMAIIYLDELMDIYSRGAPRREIKKEYGETRMARSVAMFLAASEYKGPGGLWKIGNNHVLDILEAAKDWKAKGTHLNEIDSFTNRVRLMKKEEFFAGYNAWLNKADQAVSTNAAAIPDLGAVAINDQKAKKIIKKFESGASATTSAPKTVRAGASSSVSDLVKKFGGS